MFVLSKQENVTFRAIAMLLAVALLMWVVAGQMTAQAANLTEVSNTLSDSDRSALSDHVIEYTIPSGSAGVEATESITVTFPNGFNISTSSVGLSDIDLEVDGVDETLVLGAPGAAQWQVATSGQDLVFTAGASESIAALATVTIKVGTAADGGTDQVTNHSTTGSYEFLITSGTGANNDTGRTRVAILDNVDVTATVDTTFDFTVTGFAAAGTDANGTTTTATSSSTAIPFGTLTAGDIETIAQRLNVTTNAIQGFVVTVEQDQNLLSSTGADIDGFANGTYTNAPGNWSTPSNSISNENTWGHWGLTSTDTDDFGGLGTFQACGNAATEGCWVAASTTPRQVFAHDGPSDGTTVNVGSTTVAYQVEITALQEAADDYSTTLTYIATPTF